MKQKTTIQPLGLRHGVPVYDSNPSVPNSSEIAKRKAIQVGNEQRGFVFDSGSGELVSIGGAAFYEFEEVDDTRFVKLFLAGLKQATGLSKPGLAVFEQVYFQLQQHHGQDKIMLSAQTSGMAKATYHRGLRELLEREFLFLSPFPGVFFVNIRYMFNGDRLAFVKGYRRRKTPSINELQTDLFPSTD